MSAASLFLTALLSLGPFERNHPLVEKGKAAYDAGKYEEALTAFEEAKKALPDSAAVEFNEANTLFRLDRMEEAKAAYQRVLGVGNGSLAEADLYNLGNALAQMGDDKGAIDAYRKALVQNPKDEAARHNLEIVLKHPKPPPQDGGTDGGSDAGQNGQDAGTDGGSPKNGSDGGSDGGSPKGSGDAGADGGRGDGGESQPNSDESETGDAGMPPPEESDGGLTPEEAKQLLDAVKQNEKNLQLWRFQKKKQRRPNEKDW